MSPSGYGVYGAGGTGIYGYGYGTAGAFNFGS